MIDIVWFGGYRGSWDHGLLMSIFDKHPDIFIQHNTKNPPTSEKAIVIIIGRPNEKQVREYLEKIKSGLVILTSDEDSFFDWKAAIPERFEIWTQYYAPNKSEIKTRLLLGAPSRIKDYQTSPLPKKYLWSFIGQVQNPHRQRCVEVLKQMLSEGAAGYLKIVEGFSGNISGEVEYQNYLDIMRQSKFVICPSGSMCTDTFRVYEAMECGAIPVVELNSPRDDEEFFYWAEVDDTMLFPMLHAWSDLPEILNANYHNVETTCKIWQQYKSDLEQKLLDYAK